MTAISSCSDEQYDDHIWLKIHGEAWAIQARIGPILMLRRGYEPNVEWASIDISGIDWPAYCEMAAQWLRQ